MKIPPDAVIANDKLTAYLLAPKARNDKSKFLAQAGFTQQNPEALLEAIRRLATEKEAIPHRIDDYGTFYQVEGMLKGVNGVDLTVTTIWMEQSNGQVKFITLVPRKELDET